MDKPQLRPLRALAHPLWIASLVALVLNDHWLKGAHVAPGWLTGKLSDCSGLVVAPPLFSALVRARSRRSVAFAYLAVGVVFAAIKTWPVASHLYERALAFVNAKNVMDPSDLIALVVLPIGWFVLRPRMDRAYATSGRGHRALVILGGIACVATPAQRPPQLVCPPMTIPAGERRCERAFPSRLFLANEIGHSATVTVRSLRADIACSQIDVPPQRLPCMFPEGLFGPPRSITLHPRQNEPIGKPVETCDVALIALDAWHVPVLAVQHAVQHSGAGGDVVPYYETSPGPDNERRGGLYLGGSPARFASPSVTVIPYVCEADR